MTKTVSRSSIRGACQLPSDAGLASVLQTRMPTFFIGREVGCGHSQRVSEDNLGIETPAGAQRFLWRIPGDTEVFDMYGYDGLCHVLAQDLESEVPLPSARG